MKKLVIAATFVLLTGCTSIMGTNLAQEYVDWCKFDAPDWWFFSCTVQYVGDDRNNLLSHDHETRDRPEPSRDSGKPDHQCEF